MLLYDGDRLVWECEPFLFLPSFLFFLSFLFLFLWLARSRLQVVFSPAFFCLSIVFFAAFGVALGAFRVALDVLSRAEVVTFNPRHFWDGRRSRLQLGLRLAVPAPVYVGSGGDTDGEQ